MGDVYFVIIPVVIVVVVLKLCLICWRIWLYQKRRERVIVLQSQARAQPVARIVGVERTLGPDGYTQRTAYVINERGVPPRHVTRTVTIRPRENGRPHDPNMPPTYDQAVTGKDKSVKVNAENSQTPATAEVPSNPPPFPRQPPIQPPVQPSAPTYSAVAPPTASGGLPPPPAYTTGGGAAAAGSSDQDGDDHSLSDDTTHLLA